MGANRILPIIPGQSSAQIIKGSLRFDSAGQHRLTRLNSSAGNRRTWTVSFWTKRSLSNSSFYQSFLINRDSASYNLRFDRYLTDGTESNAYFAFAASVNFTGSRKLRDAEGWKHIVVIYDSNNSTQADRFRWYINGIREQNFTGTVNYPSQGTQSEFNSNANYGIGYFNTNTAWDGLMSQYYMIDGQALGPEYFGFTDPLTNTWRPKKYNTTAPTNNPNNNTTWSDNVSASSGGFGVGEEVTKGFDGNTATKCKTNTNGASITITFSGVTVEKLLRIRTNYTNGANSSVTVNGTNYGAASTASDGEYKAITGFTGALTSIVLAADGAVNASFSAVEVDGVILQDATTTNNRTWDSSVTFGSNGFHLPMDNEDDFEIDKSGNGNDWTKGGFSGTFNDPDVLKDSPSGTAFGGPPTSGITTISSAPANYATFNPLRLSANAPTLSENNLTVTAGGSSEWYNSGTTIDVSSGKWFWEVYPRTVGGSGFTVGVASEGYEWNRSTSATGLPWLGSATGTSWSVYSTGQKYFGASGTNYMDAFTTSDTIGVALDVNANTLTYYQNGVSKGIAFSDVSAAGKSLQIGLSVHGSGSNKASINFGQKPFKFPPPEGFLPLNSSSARPSTVIARPDRYVGIVTYTGNDGTQSLNVGLKPDLVWVKNRDSDRNHYIYDSVRGAGTAGDLSPNTLDNEDTLNTGLYGYLSEFTSNGFIVIDGTDATGNFNSLNQRYVAWCWKAGGNKNTFNVDDIGYASAAAAGLTAGSLSPTGASVNKRAGFSISTLTPTSGNFTISHGLNSAPSFVIMKSRTQDPSTWFVYHRGLGSDKFLRLQDGSTFATNTTIWQDTDPSSTVVYSSGASLGTTNYVMYCWADVPGLQKFGSYTGNASLDGPFIETGFRPRWLLIRRSNGAANWYLVDSERDPHNTVDLYLKPNESSQEIDTSTEGTKNYIDFLSNGFKLRGTELSTNAAQEYIYAAFAEAPSFNLYGGQSNAR